MGALRQRPLHRMLSAAFTFVLFASLLPTITLTSLGRKVGEEVQEPQREENGLETPVVISHRRQLGGPGSSPPTCRSNKCGSCSPCEPVHVPIPPGISIPLEYYPEAWRCKCGNKLFMP